MKRIICVLLSLIMVFSLGACVNKGGDSSVKPLKDVTVKMLLPGSEKPADFNNVLNAINDKLEEDGKPYDVNIEFYDDIKYHQDLPLKASEYDVAHVSVDYYKDYLKTNALMDATAILAAYGKDIVDNTQDFAKKSSMYKGKQYLIPRNMPIGGKDFVAARKDWMTEYGMTEIDTIEDLDDYFSYTHAKIGDPTKNKYVYSADDNYSFLTRAYAPSYFFPVRQWASMPVYIDISDEGKENGKYVVKNYYESEAYIDLISKTREYYVLQYVTPDQLQGSYSYFVADQLGLVWDTLLKQSERIDNFKGSNSTGELYSVYLNKDEPKYIFEGIDNTMALLSGAKNPNEAVDFLNWIRSSQENHDLACYGVLGVNYKLTADGRLDFTGIAKNKNYSENMPYWAFNDVRFTRWSKNLSQEYIDEVTAWNTPASNAVVNPLMGFIPSIDNVEYDTAVKNVHAVAGLATHLTNGRTDPSGMNSSGQTNYNQLLLDLNNAGINKLITLLQAQIDAYLGQ